MSALMLRIIACVAMLLDHIGYAFGIAPLRIVGRVAFPIFVFLIYNGYRYTSSPAKYALRLAVFALVSQVPFALFCHYSNYFQNGNVFLTLLMALLSIWAADTLAKNRVTKWFCLLPAVLVIVLYDNEFFKSDYGAKGILMAMVFWLLDGKVAWKRGLTCVLILCAVCYPPIQDCVRGLVEGNGFLFSLTSWEKTQIWSLLALPLIFVYNGEKGKIPGGKAAAKAAQIGFYAFYPVHLLLLWMITK